GRPRVLLPAALWARLSEAQRDALLLHELAHLRRGDHWVRRLELAVLGLYWWLPTVWWARREIQRAEEECCDAWVVWASPRSADEGTDIGLGVPGDQRNAPPEPPAPQRPPGGFVNVQPPADPTQAGPMSGGARAAYRERMLAPLRDEIELLQVQVQIAEAKLK